MILEGGHRSSHYPTRIVMKTNYQKALELLEESRYVDGPEATIMVAQAQVYATLALVDAQHAKG